MLKAHVRPCFNGAWCIATNVQVGMQTDGTEPNKLSVWTVEVVKVSRTTESRPADHNDWPGYYAVHASPAEMKFRQAPCLSIYPQN